MEPCNSSLLRDMNNYIKQTSRTVGTPPITISTTCRKLSSFSVASFGSNSDSLIPKHSLSIMRTALSPAQTSLHVLSWLPPWAPSHMGSPNSWDPKPTMMGSIPMHWSKTSEHYSTMCRKQVTAWQYITPCESIWSLRVVTRCIFCMNHCTQWSFVLTMVFGFK